MKPKSRRFTLQSFTDVGASILAILAGLLVGFIIMLISNPSQAVDGFVAILTGGVKDMKSMGQVLYFATPIIMTGLSVGFANKTGLFNIGASGQFIVGAYFAILVGVQATALPGPLRLVLALLAAAAAGGLWGAVPGLLKALLNVNEVIACIMMNYIGMYFVNFMVVRTVFDSLKNQTTRVPSEANLPKWGMDQLFRSGASASSVNSGIILAVIMAVVIFIVLQKTRFGYEQKAVGLNRDAARYAGISQKRSVVLSMVIAGALAGLGGAFLYLSGSGKAIDVVDVLAAEGFNGIPVALLGLSNPIGIIFSGLFVAYLTVGGFNMQLYEFAPQVIEIITAVIIYFSAFALLVKNIVERVRRKRQEAADTAKPPDPPPGASPPVKEVPTA
ncbi:MAG: ABC transporter permease [Ruminococcaceae bacterium]|nr:ABC transporter permease [Oscillospiraceae bacterium]